MIEARLYSKGANGTVDCNLCAHRCHIGDGKRGICGVRVNDAGTLYSAVYGKIIAEHVDPIEKKPLFHFQPGSTSYSIATVGCNFRCLHCQNSDISQMPRTMKKIIGEDATPEEIVSEAFESGASSISYTYTEPTIFFEFAYDCAVLAKERALKNVFVTNGYMTSECLNELSGVLDAANVDVKSFSDKFYKKVCGATLAPVLDSVVKMRAMGIWVEITTLVIPGYNDSDDEFASIAKWMASVDPAMPWHISAFHPSYKLMDAPITPVETLERALKIGYDAGLKFVYTGNIQGIAGESTRCPSCKKTLIERIGFSVKKNVIEESKCPYCRTVIEGVDL